MKSKYKLPIYILSVIVFSKFFFYPANIDTRFSLGIIVINFILLVEKGNFYKKLIGYSAIIIFLERLLCFTLIDNLSIFTSITKVYPIFFYYISYISILTVFRFGDLKKDRFIYKYGILFLTDASSIIIELFTRGEIASLSLKYILFVSFLRVSGAFLIYLIYKYRVMIITNEIHQEKYLSLNLMVSSLEAELFYLKKSSIDIEEVMKKAHKLYGSDTKDLDTKEQCLDIAREVHEIKKDYLRIIRGMEENLSSFKKGNSLSLSKLKEIVFESTTKYIEGSQKEIEFIIEEVPYIELREYHKIFILVNNLITNSIDAIDNKGTIRLSINIIDNKLVLRVSDDGKGILEKNIKLLFNAGFTTKYDTVTGEMNTGLGLSHIKNIVESFNGTIDVTSKLSAGTSFTIKIPLDILTEGEL